MKRYKPKPHEKARLKAINAQRTVERFARAVAEQASGMDRLDRETLRLGRWCVGCREADGVRCYPVLGWVCSSCEEVLEIVYETEIERTREALSHVESFLGTLAP